CQHHNNYPYTF
nr:immunoglobulin light chain junction region [Macaca mulatta]MOW34372.1 immunoglobulin light chain junction region [Macaca mulatta]MOW34410.1 immunoglobulin light chain junction region [Macaca mulatta]MOW34615.1 immunoglobulin light chain junction region [Macaca mulatta]MOW34664.1 immunoglobulin light chain junction region [Macaca mulatta]